MTNDRLEQLKNSGYMDHANVLVGDNVFDIPRRLREINPNFFVVFNPNTQLYELHDEKQKSTFCLTFPFDELDSRCLDYTRQRLVDRADTLFKQMREKNLKLEADSDNKFIDEVGEASKDIYNYAVRRSIDGDIDTGPKNKGRKG
jgi:pentatricopeptide repeat protein